MSSQYLSLVSDPAALMNMWDNVINSMSDLSGVRVLRFSWCCFMQWGLIIDAFCLGHSNVHAALGVFMVLHGGMVKVACRHHALLGG